MTSDLVLWCPCGRALVMERLLPPFGEGPTLYRLYCQECDLDSGYQYSDEEANKEFKARHGLGTGRSEEELHEEFKGYSGL
jgi:hypothetical protein